MKFIPIAQPIEQPIEQPIAQSIAQPIEQPIAQSIAQPISTISSEICNTCFKKYTRSEEDKMTSRYFRCKECIDKQVFRSIQASCILQ